LSNENNKITLAGQTREEDGSLQYTYDRSNQTSFYDQVSLEGDHTFGGHKVTSEDIQAVEQLYGITFYKDQVSPF
jgi:hypothetical protein